MENETNNFVDEVVSGSPSQNDAILIVDEENLSVVVAELRKVNAILMKKNSDQEQQILELKDEVSTTAEGMEKAQKENAILQRRFQDLEISSSIYVCEFKILNKKLKIDHLEEMDDLKCTYNQKNGHLGGIIGDLRKKLRESENSSEKLAALKSQYVQKTGQSGQIIRDLRKELDELKSRFNINTRNLEQTIGKLRKELTESSEKLATLKSQYNQKTGQLGRTIGDLRKLIRGDQSDESSSDDSENYYYY